jgi:hypothetical protein
MSAEIVTLLPAAKAAYVPVLADRCPNREAAFDILCRALGDVHSRSISEARAGIERALRHVREAERLNEPRIPPFVYPG